jgi:hypothetical protein
MGTRILIDSGKDDKLMLYNDNSTNAPVFVPPAHQQDLSIAKKGFVI